MDNETATDNEMEPPMPRSGLPLLALAVAGLLCTAAEVRAQAGQWQAYCDTGWKLARDGEWSSARSYLLKAHQQAQELAPNDPRRALTLAYLAFVSFKQARQEDADGYAREALAIYDSLPLDAPTAALVSKGLNALALVYQGKRDFDQADQLYQRALAAMEKVIGSNAVATAQLLANRAALREAQGRYEEAEALQLQQLQVLDVRNQPKRAAQAAAAYQQLGHLYRVWGRYSQAEPQLLEAVELRRGAKKDSPQLAESLAELGCLYFDMGRYQWAEQPLREALTIREKTAEKLPAEKLSDFAENMHNLASVYVVLGRYAEAEPLLNRALAIREKASPDGDVRTVATLQSLGTLQQEQKRYPQAEESFQRSLRIVERAVGPDRFEVAGPVEALAMLYALTKNSTEAERYYLRALAIREKALGSAHRSVAATLHNLANLYRDDKRFDDAEPLYQRSLAAKEKALGASHISLAPLLEHYAVLLEQTKRVDEGAKLIRRAKDIRAKAPLRSY